MENTHSPKRKFIHSGNSIYWKAAFILLLILLLMIPNGMIQSLIRERQNNKYQVQNEIAASWGGRQTISGPILAIPYTLRHIGDDGKDWITEHTYFLAPDKVNIASDIQTEIRKKSIYEEVLYTTGLDIEGSFNLNLIGDKKLEMIDWENVSLVIGIYDPSGINAEVTLKYNSSNQAMVPGSNHKSAIQNGIHTIIDLSNQPKDHLNFSTHIDLRGHYNLYFQPTAKNTQITMHADWPSPSFVGKVLADKREITDEGFVAQWKVSEFSRSVPNYWTDGQHSISQGNNSFGVDLIQPVDHYQKNMRSAKYALLIISLSFLAFFFFEMMYHNKVHPVQYAIIGLALSIFYYLLLSISEYFGFDAAYIIAAISVIVLIVGYSKSIFNNNKSVSILAIILILLYSYIFVLLQLEEYALLAGSIGLFCILAMIMYLSRNVDWYSIGQQNEK